MRFYLKTKNSVKGKTLVLHSVLKKVGNAIKKNCSQSKNVFQNRPLAGYTLLYPRNYIRCRSRGNTTECF